MRYQAPCVQDLEHIGTSAPHRPRQFDTAVAALRPARETPVPTGAQVRANGTVCTRVQAARTARAATRAGRMRRARIGFRLPVCRAMQRLTRRRRTGRASEGCGAWCAIWRNEEPRVFFNVFSFPHRIFL